MLSLFLPCLLGLLLPGGDDVPSERALGLAARTRKHHGERAIETLAALVAFDTYHREGTDNAEHPSFQAMTVWLKSFADDAGLSFADHGHVVVVGLGSTSDRLGVVTHGDVQPADPDKWARSPFELDLESEPGRLVGRGTEDDKGPIACALHAMAAIKETGWTVHRGVELIISYTEESDWGPFQEFLERYPPPDLNVGFDANYPVVIAEKGWCTVGVRMPLGEAEAATDPALTSFGGGFFLSQVPEDAVATIARPTPAMEEALRDAARVDTEVTFTFEPGEGTLVVRAHGRSVHSSVPEQGRNAITHLARVLGAWSWPGGAHAGMVAFTNDLVGTGFHGEQFGELAYADPFMGPLTLSFGTLTEEDGHLVGGINLRRPVGRSREQVEQAVREAVAAWQEATAVELTLEMYIGEPHPPVDAPHVPILLDTFRHHTGDTEAEPISIGGGTHARLVPNGVNFGPAMPGVPYTGHSEHEFITREQFLLNLQMYTSLLVDLAVEERS